MITLSYIVCIVNGMLRILAPNDLLEISMAAYTRTMKIIHEEPSYTTEYGWSDELAEQIVIASRQAAILQHTPNDAAERFPDMAAANDWHLSGKSPEVYSLHERTSQQLAGLAWFSWQQSEALAPSYNATFAIRLYDIARGKHLSYPFAAAVHADFEQQQTDKLTGLWLETDTDNQPAQQLYRKLGYTTLTVIQDRLLMVRNMNHSKL